MTQSEALDILKTGANVFLTGEPGAGKTYTVNSYVRYLKECGIEPSITASTGIAATHIGGMTIHSWSGIGIKRYLSKYDLDRIASNERVVKRIEKARVLIIDEVSMLGPETLDMVDAVCRAIKRSHEAFGSLSVILVGDFFQLPPVVRREESGDTGDLDQGEQLFKEQRARFAFESSAWARANFLTCYLSEQYRQDDPTLLNILSAIRRNEFEQEHMEHIERRKVKGSAGLENIPQLYAHNVDVDRVNTSKLALIKNDEKLFEMTSDGPAHMIETLQRGCLSPQKLILKVGATVMCTKNSLDRKYVNGTQGIVSSFDTATGYPIITARSGRKILIEPAEWTIEDGGKIRARIKQLPLRLSWAITVHKSQGMSMDAALMDLSGTFEHGQGYVALSRVRRLEGLHLLGWNAKAFEVNPDVLVRDSQFRASSGEASEVFAKLDKQELGKMHGNFIKAVGGKLTKKESKESRRLRLREGEAFGKKSYDLSEVRKKYPNAYMPWTKDEDGKLIQRFKSDIKTKEIAQELGRQTGSIRARLRKHGLIE